MQHSRRGGDEDLVSCSPEGIAAAAAAAPPDSCDLSGGIPAAFDGASDSCPELALAELAPEAFLHIMTGLEQHRTVPSTGEQITDYALIC